MNDDYQREKSFNKKTQAKPRTKEKTKLKAKDKMQIEFEFFDEMRLRKRTHGGMRSNAKVARPFVPGKWLHICNRSQRAVGQWSMLGFQNRIFIRNLIDDTARRCFVQVADFVNMGNHFHLKAKAKRKEDLQRFLRIIGAQIARYIMKANKGESKGKFWDGLIFSRLLMTAMEELRLKGYFQANRIEKTEGQKKRGEFLLKHRDWVNKLRKTKQSQYQFLKA